MPQNAHAVFAKALLEFIPAKRIYTDPLRTLAYGTDASVYRLIPRVVVDVDTEAEVIQLLRLARRLQLPVTFRAAGTSLSGQAVSDSILVRLGRGWTAHRLDAEAHTISLQPGVIGAAANALLAPLGKKIGPDPASIDSCKIGGIFANNASGMCCGTADNSYKTLVSSRLILHDGTLLDTADAHSREAFRVSHGELLQRLSNLRAKVMADDALAGRIRSKFKIKNTTGYSLNALVDFDDPFEILQHLMVGSEGTLGFVAEVTYRTVPDLPHKASALLLFPTVHAACAAVAVLAKAPVDSVELMDRASLRSVEGQPGLPEGLEKLDDAVCSLLVETRAATASALTKAVTRLGKVLEQHPTLRPVEFSKKPADIARLQRVRKGILPCVGAARPVGTSVVIEDVAVPVDKLADAALDLQALFTKHGYTVAPIFGHALDGNLHFVFAQDFSSAPELARYAAFMEDLCGLITAKYDGSLKAEHGTGRNVAPFVELEWGAAAYALMREIKDALDPDGILNPGVILNDDPQIHLKNIKPLHPAHELIDRCTECGFCEPTCPSRDLTLTPRQRITAHREIVRLEAERENPVQGAGGQGNPDRETLERLASLRKAYAYAGNATCAADGLCSLRCPAKINTGSFIKDLRRQEAGKAAEVVSGFVADHFSGTCKVMSKLLDGVDALHGFVGSELMADGSRLLRLLSFKRAPAWNRAMPKGGGALPNPSSSLPGRQAVAQSQAASAQSDTAQSQAASAQNDAAQLDAGQSAVSSSAPAVATQAVEQPKPLRVVYFPACISRLMGPGKEHSDVRSEPQVFVSLLLKAGCEVIIPKGLEKLCCGMAFASKGLTGAAARKAAELGRALREASHDGEYPVVSETSPCLLHMRETQDASLRLYEPIQFILEHLADKLSFTRLPKTVAVHATCSVRKMDLAGKLALLAGMCAAHVVVPEGVDCCGFAGDRGFTHPELNESALKPLRLQVSGCEAGYSVGRTCQIGLSLHGGIPYYSILHLVDEATAPI